MIENCCRSLRDCRCRRELLSAIPTIWVVSRLKSPSSQKKVLPKDEHKISATWEKIAGTKESDEASVHLLITTDAPIEEWYCVGWRIVDACWELRLVECSPYSLYSIMLGRIWGSWDRLQREARDRLQREQQNSFYTVFFGTFDRFYLVQLTFSEKRTSGPEGRKYFYRDQLQREVVSSSPVGPKPEPHNNNIEPVTGWK